MTLANGIIITVGCFINIVAKGIRLLAVVDHVFKVIARGQAHIQHVHVIDHPFWEKFKEDRHIFIRFVPRSIPSSVHCKTILRVFLSYTNMFALLLSIIYFIG